MDGEDGPDAPLLGQDTEAPAPAPEVRYKYRYYSLPLLRYNTVVRALLFVDSIVCIALWAAGGNEKYFVDNIVHFHLLASVFDIVLLTTVKVIVLVILYTSLEDTTLETVRDPYNPATVRRKQSVHIAVLALSVLFLAYSVIKGSLVLVAYLNDPDYVLMHLVYNIALASSVCLGLVELVCAVLSWRAMRRLVVIRVLHRLNEHLQEVDEEGKVAAQKVNVLRLVKLAKNEVRLILVASLCLLGSTASQTASPLFFGYVVDAAQRSMADLNRTVIILLSINLVGAVFASGRSWLFTLAGQRMVAKIRKDLFTAIIRQDVAFFDTNRTGELINRLSSDTQVVQNAVTVNVSMLVRNILQIVGSLVFMFVLNPALTGVLLAVVPVISMGAVQYGKFVMRIRKTFQDRLADASTTAEESISSIRTVRSFAGEAKASGLYAESIDKSYAEGRKLAMASGGFEGLIGMIIAGAIALVLWYGGKLVNELVITPGILTSFLLYTMNVAFAFGLLSSLYGDFMQAVGASVRIFDLFDKVPDIANEGGAVLDGLNEGVEFDSVHFTYPSRPDNKVLESVSFSVSRGEMVALVGPSGGGKSTIVSLIERFYDPNQGTVRLGGRDLRDLDPQWYRRQMSVVSQEPTLFACSIKDNITYGRQAGDAEVEAAARQANAHDFIVTFEDGYDTLVGERGVRLSGGQKQRVAIARALIMNPDILLLDEATSALDAESEHLVQEAVDRAMVNRTVLVIAHRLSTVRNAHKVIVIDKGQIAEQGTHDELLAKNGVYKKLVLRQLTAGQVNDGNDSNSIATVAAGNVATDGMGDNETGES